MTLNEFLELWIGYEHANVDQYVYVKNYPLVQDKRTGNFIKDGYKRIEVRPLFKNLSINSIKDFLDTRVGLKEATVIRTYIDPEEHLINIEIE